MTTTRRARRHRRRLRRLTWSRRDVTSVVARGDGEPAVEQPSHGPRSPGRRYTRGSRRG